MLGVIERIVSMLIQVRDSGRRLFLLGVGGSAVNCGMLSITFVRLTARTNDEGWGTVFAEWLKTSRLHPTDALSSFQSEAKNVEKNVSPNLVQAIIWHLLVSHPLLKFSQTKRE